MTVAPVVRESEIADIETLSNNPLTNSALITQLQNGVAAELNLTQVPQTNKMDDKVSTHENTSAHNLLITNNPVHIIQVQKCVTGELNLNLAPQTNEMDDKVSTHENISPNNYQTKPENITQVKKCVAGEINLNRVPQTNEQDDKISTNENGTIGIKQEQQQRVDGYDMQESALDLSPGARKNVDNPFSFDGAHEEEGVVKKNVNNVADIQKRERDARDWAMKTILVIGTASLALTTLYDSYVHYCERNRTKPLPIKQLEKLLKSIFPRSAIQNVEVNGVTKHFFVGIQRLMKGGSNQMEQEQKMDTHILGNDHSRNLNKKKSDQEFNNVHSQIQTNNKRKTPPNSTPTMFDFENKNIKSEPVDLRIKKPKQPPIGESVGGRLYEPSHGSEAEERNKVMENRMFVNNYQHHVENRCPTYGNINLNLEMLTVDDDIENCRCAARRLSHLISWMKDNDHLKLLLKHFAHSSSCSLEKCSPFCMMSRRLRRHVMSAKHECVLLKFFSFLLRLHVFNCVDNNCGLQSCPSLKVIRDQKRQEAVAALTGVAKPAPFRKLQANGIFPFPPLGNRNLPNPPQGNGIFSNPQLGNRTIPNHQQLKRLIPNPQQGNGIFPNPQQGNRTIQNPQQVNRSIPNPQQGNGIIANPKFVPPTGYRLVKIIAIPTNRLGNFSIGNLNIQN